MSLLVALASAVEHNTNSADPQNSEIYDGLIIGVGSGTFTVIICIFISITCCFFKNSCVYPNLCTFCAILLPAIVFLIIYLSPKESVASDKTQEDTLPTSWYFMKTVFFLCVICIVFLISLIALCSMKLQTIQIRRIDSEVGNERELQGSKGDAKGYTQVTEEDRPASPPRVSD